MSVFGIIVVSMATYASASLRFTSVVHKRGDAHVAVEGASRLALDKVRYGSYSCTAAPTTILDVTLNSYPVNVQCTRQESVVNQWVRPAVVVTQADGLRIEDDRARIAGDIYFAVPPTSLNKILTVEDGDIWMGSSNCNTWTPTTVTKITIYDPTVRSFQCASNNWSSIFTAPVLPAVPAPAPSPILINTNQCRVFFPGSYSPSNPLPSFDKQVDTYFKSGLYYFNNIGQVKIKETIVVGGLPGEALNEESGERLWLPGCANAASNPLVNDAGQGVTLVLGGNSNIKVDDKGGLELFAPPDGDSIVAYSALTNGYAATNTAGGYLIDQSTDHSALRVHGRIWAPTSRIVFGDATESFRTVANEAAIGGQLFGGVVAAYLKIQKSIEDGYNMQVETVEPHFKVLLVATGGGSTLRVVADARPGWYEIAITSWWLS